MARGDCGGRIGRAATTGGSEGEGKGLRRARVAGGANTAGQPTRLGQAAEAPLAREGRWGWGSGCGRWRTFKLSIYCELSVLESLFPGCVYFRLSMSIDLLATSLMVLFWSVVFFSGHHTF